MNRPLDKASLSPVPLALIAGRGHLPRLLIKAAQSQGRPLVLIAIEGQTDPELLEGLPHIWITFGQVGKLIAYLKENAVGDIVMAGYMTRPSFSSLKPDWEGVKWLSKIAAKSFGDDNLLRAVIEMVESYGFRVVGVDDVLSTLLAPEGPLTKREPTSSEWEDIQRGCAVLHALSDADVGQAVAIRQGVVMAVEAIEGTDAMMARTGDLARQMPLEDARPLVVKMAKRGQERRADLPTIGLGTVRSLVEAGIAGIAIETGKTLILDREAVVQAANEAGLFVVGISWPQAS